MTSSARGGGFEAVIDSGRVLRQLAVLYEGFARVAFEGLVSLRPIRGYAVDGLDMRIFGVVADVERSGS
jgi:hypothetical protein